MKTNRLKITVALLTAAFTVFALSCGGKSSSGLNGVDKKNKILRIGFLNDLSGPAATIGKPFDVGKRILAERVNAGGSGILPEGWKIEMVNRDHSYNPQKSLEMFKQIKDEVLFIGTSFGTPNTLPLRPHLKNAEMVAFPASLSSAMAVNPHTPPLGVSYQMEAMRAMDWVIKQGGGKDKVKAGIIFQNDDYGKDGHAAWKKAADKLGVKIVSEQGSAPGQKDYAAAISALKDAGATHVLLSVLPSATGPILGTAFKLKFNPIWIGNTPAWVDAFFSHKLLPPPVFANYYQLSGLPFWGEKVPGMDVFLDTFKKYGKTKEDSYILLSYTQGLLQLKAFNIALKNGDVTRKGYLKALQSIKDEDLGGMVQPISLNTMPYKTGTKVRVLKPDFAKKSWKVIADYASPTTAD